MLFKSLEKNTTYNILTIFIKMITITYEDLSVFIPSLNHLSTDGKRKYLLNIGCGTISSKRLPLCFQNDNIWQEIKLDIDPNVKPDIVADMTDMGMIKNNSIDAIFSSHNLEHLETHMVPIALKEMLRILKFGGFILVNLPDLETIAKLILDGKLENTLYNSLAGPVSPLDMLFGHNLSIQKGNSFMAHRTGFTAKRLGNLLIQAGFKEVRIIHGDNYDLWAIAIAPNQ